MAVRKEQAPVYKVDDETETAHAAARVTIEWAGRDWLEEIAKTRKPSTQEFYSPRVAVFRPWAEANCVVYLDQLTPKVLHKYRNWRIEHVRVSSGTASRRSRGCGLR